MSAGGALVLELGQHWNSGPWLRSVDGNGVKVWQQGPVKIIGFQNRRGEAYAIVEDLATRSQFRVNRTQFGAAGRLGYRRLP